MTPGRASGQVTSQKASSARGAEVLRGFDQVEVQALERGIQRQDHERQVRIGQADEDGEVGVDELDGLVDQCRPTSGSC